MKKIITLSACMLMAAALAVTAGCQPKEQEGVVKQADAENGSSGIEVAWSADMDCSMCHQAQHDSLTAAHVGQTCLDCHVDTSGLGAVHEGKTAEDKAPTRLKKTDVADAACEACHDSYAVLAEKTVDSTILTDSQGTVVNPHEARDLGPEEHLDLTCAECHAEHGDQTVEEAAREVCLNCHHDDVYECGTCHTI